MAKLSILLVLALIVAAVAQDDISYTEAKTKYSLKVVNADEDIYRKSVFSHNLESIKANNANPKSTYKSAVNKFALMTTAEFKKFLGARPPSGLELLVSTPVVGWNIVKAKDWSKNTNIVTATIRDQGGCGSCWAFSAVAALESLISKANLGNVDLSEQQLISCSSSHGNSGCDGGWMNNAFSYVKANGIAKESDYPHTSGNTGTTGSCVATQSSFKISAYEGVPNNCDSVAAAVIKRPLSVAVVAANWGSYSQGIFNNCPNPLAKVDHGVLLVGVTNTTWKIKNSWGNWWGEGGFMRLRANNGANTCRICDYASFPKNPSRVP
jgi:cathepsin L